MNLPDIDMNDLQRMVNSMRGEDIDALKEMAATLFSGGQEPQPDTSATQSENKSPSGGAPLPFDLETLTKIASLLSALQSEKSDPRCDLLYALRPMLREERQHRVDQAARMLQLLSILPKLKSLDL